MRVSFRCTPAPPSRACISVRCLIVDKRAGQCQPHHNRPGFSHHANNCQATGPPLCCTLIDISPLARFMGVRTFLSVTSNWSDVPLAGGPRPWQATTWPLSPSVWKTMQPPVMNYLQCSHRHLVKTSHQHLLSECGCVFSQLLRETYPAWTVKRANIQVCQG